MTWGATAIAAVHYYCYCRALSVVRVDVKGRSLSHIKFTGDTKSTEDKIKSIDVIDSTAVSTDINARKLFGLSLIHI